MTDPIILDILSALGKAEKEGTVLCTSDSMPWDYTKNGKKISILFTEGRGMTQMPARGRGSIPCTYSMQAGAKTEYYTRALTGSYTPLLADIIQQAELAEKDVVLHVKITFRNGQIFFDAPDEMEVVPAFRCSIKRVAAAAENVQYENGRIVYSTGKKNGFLATFHWGAPTSFAEYKIVPDNLMFNRQKFETTNTHFAHMAPEVICGSKKIAADLRNNFVEGRMNDLMEVMNDFYQEQGAQKITNQGLDWALEKWGETYHGKKLESEGFSLG